MEGVEQPRKRMLTDKQKEALKEGRQRRWESLRVPPPGGPEEDYNQEQQLPEHPQPPPSQQKEKPQHPFFDLNSSESSDSEEDDDEPEPYMSYPQELPKHSSKKPKILKAIKRRVDRYIEEKMREFGPRSNASTTPSTMYYNRASAPMNLQYL